MTSVHTSPQEVVVFNSNGKQITVKIDGDEAEANMEVLVFAHQGEGGGRHTLEINYSLTWATEIKRGIDMMIKHGEISVDSSLIPYIASLVGRTTTADVREVLGADNAVVELAIEILSCAPDVKEIVGSQRLDELISISRWGDSIGGIVCTLGVLKEAGIILYSCTEARMLLRQLQMYSKRMKSRQTHSNTKALTNGRRELNTRPHTAITTHCFLRTRPHSSQAMP
jgi:hypothetical protein